MDDKTWMGSLGEAAVTAFLTRHRVHVFSQISGKAPFDLIAWKDGVTKTISVKSTSRKKGHSYEVELRSTRHNKTRTVVKKFDSSLCDILAVYIVPLDCVCLLDTSIVHGRSGLCIAERATSQRPVHLIEDLQNVDRVFGESAVVAPAWP